MLLNGSTRPIDRKLFAMDAFGGAISSDETGYLFQANKSSVIPNSLISIVTDE